MIKLLVIADDFTGALDTGVKFADAGARTQVIATSSINLSSVKPDVEVLVLDLGTRHKASEVAYELVRNIAQAAKEFGVPFLLKKTDSALRGNIGCELKALIDGCDKKFIPFIPALPSLNRVIENGILTINGTEVADSVFGRDPFTPVLKSNVADIIALQTNVPTSVVKLGAKTYEKNGIVVFDSLSDKDVRFAAKLLFDEGDLNIMAGCSGLGGVLPDLLSLGDGSSRKFEYSERFIVMCGSVNPITTSQVEYARAFGFKQIELSFEEKTDASFWETESGRNRIDEIISIINENPKVVISTFDEVDNPKTLELAANVGISATEIGSKIALSIGQLLTSIMKSEINATYLVTGGDTLLGFMKQINKYELDMITEINLGCVLSQIEYEFKTKQIISKSGGFGNVEIFVDISNIILDKRKCREC